MYRQFEQPRLNFPPARAVERKNRMHRRRGEEKKCMLLFAARYGSKKHTLQPILVMSQASPRTPPTAMGRMVQQMIQRERKRYAVMTLTMPNGEALSAPRVLKLAWEVTEGDAARVLDYWHHQSALLRWRGATEDLLSLRKMLQPVRRGTRKKEQSAHALALAVWNLEQRATEHLQQYPPVYLAGKWHTPPMPITAADVLPMSMAEMRLLLRRSAKKLREYCAREIAGQVNDFRQAMTA